MGKHLRKLFSVNEVKKVFERYLSQEIAVEHALVMLKIRRRQFFKLLKVYRERPDCFAKVSWNTLKFSLSGVPIRDQVELRISLT